MRIAVIKQDLQKTLANLEDQSKSIVDHYELIKEYGMEVPAMEQASFQMMAVDFTSCKEAMDLVEDAKPLNIKKFSSDLSNEVNLLRKDVIDIRTSAQAPMILSASMQGHKSVYISISIYIYNIMIVEYQNHKHNLLNIF